MWILWTKKIGLLLAISLLAVACSKPVSATMGNGTEKSGPGLDRVAMATATPAAGQTSASLPTATTLPTATAVPTQTPSPTPAATATSTPPMSSAPGYRPVFERAACEITLPAGYQADCGYLVVPEDRAQPAGRQVRLYVVLFHSASDRPAPEPVIYLSGGPGSPASEDIEYMFKQGLGAVLDKYDFIFLDQRGTGRSQPALTCPERDELDVSLLAGTLPGQQQKIVDAFARCHDRFARDGVDVANYNSSASAADVNDLRIALGYKQVNLYGVSYGTRLALTVERDHPEALRSVVLDSTYPPQVHLPTDRVASGKRAFDALFDRCAADPQCNAAYPDLRNVFAQLVSRLDARPVTLTVFDASAKANRKFRLTGNQFWELLFLGMYNDKSIPRMPKMIYDARAGDYKIALDYAALYYGGGFALGMQTSVGCREDPASAAVCKVWGIPEPDPAEKEPIASDIPTLVMIGEFDPITPPAWGHLAGETLSHSYTVEFPGVGHWVTRSGKCPVNVMMSFFASPGSPPDSACTATMKEPSFAR